MKWRAHAMVAGGTAAIIEGELVRLVPFHATLLVTALVFGGGILAAQLCAILPDVIDFALKGAGASHRNGGTHGLPSLAIPIGLGGGVLWIISSRVPSLVLAVLTIPVGFVIGWTTHLLLDALTPAGIPVRGKPFTWHWAPYDSPAANQVLRVFGGICLVSGTFSLVDPVYPLFLPLLAALWASRWTADRVRTSDECGRALNEENAEVVATLTAIEVIFQRRGDIPRALAYRRAARVIRDLREPIRTRATWGPLHKIPFVGPKIAGVIEDLLRNGHSQYLAFLQGSPAIVR